MHITSLGLDDIFDPPAYDSRHSASRSASLSRTRLRTAFRLWPHHRNLVLDVRVRDEIEDGVRRQLFHVICGAAAAECNAGAAALHAQIRDLPICPGFNAASQVGFTGKAVMSDRRPWQQFGNRVHGN